MTILTIVETKKGLTLCAFTDQAELVAANYHVDFNHLSFNHVSEMVSAYVGQYVTEHALPIVAIHNSHTSTVEFLVKELSATGLPVMVAGGKTVDEMAKGAAEELARVREEQAAKQAEMQAEQEAAQAAANEEPAEEAAEAVAEPEQAEVTEETQA